MREELPPRLASVIVAAFWGSIVGLTALVIALAFGLADPRPLGRVQWEDDFSAATRWTILAGPDARVEPQAGTGGLRFSAGEASGMALALADMPPDDYSLEVAAAQVEGADSVRYGLVLGWRDSDHYTAMFLNRDGYVEAYTQDGAARTDWYRWQQWPHILYGGEANRLRADVYRDGRIEVRVNDEVVVAFEAAARGEAGPAVKGEGRSGEVVYHWAKLWSNAAP